MTSFLFILAEERQDQNAKRRKIEQAARASLPSEPNLTFKASSSKADPRAVHPSLPMRPSFDTFAAPPSPSPPVNQKSTQEKAFETGSKALGGSNSDIVANRSAIRMANMTAAEALKAEMAGLKPLKPKKTPPKVMNLVTPNVPTSPVQPPPDAPFASASNSASCIPGLDMADEPLDSEGIKPEIGTPMEPNTGPSDTTASQEQEQAVPNHSLVGLKRKLEEVDNLTPDGSNTPAEDDEPVEAIPAKKRVVHADGTVETEDTVK